MHRSVHRSTGPQTTIKSKSRDQEQCRAEVAVVEELVQCYKALSDHAAQEISPEILLSPALHHDDQDQEEYDIQMMVNSEHFVENQFKSPLNFSRYENDANAIVLLLSVNISHFPFVRLM